MEEQLIMQQKQHEEMLAQMRMDTFINGVIAASAILTFLTILIHHTSSLRQ